MTNIYSRLSGFAERDERVDTGTRRSRPATIAALRGLDRRSLGAAVLLLAIMAAGFLFRFFLTPQTGLGPNSLVQTPDIVQAVTRLLHADPLRLLLPYQYEGPGRWLWAPAMLLPMHALYSVLTPLGVYISLSSLLIATSFVTSWIALRSLVFSGTVALALGFGTHFAYGLTMGFVFGLYLFLSYVCVNLLLGFRLLTAPWPRPGPIVAFVATLVLVALSVEWWLNYAAVLLVGSGFLWLRDRRHGLRRCWTAPAFVFLSVAVVLALYLAVRLPVASEYVTSGGEEELIVTYDHWLIVLDDIAANFFTLVYSVLANYLPIFGSLSQTYVGDPAILAEQHGYHAQMTQLVVMNHLFLWRFYAGATVALFCLFGIRRVGRAWRHPAVADTVIAVLFLAVLIGCGTHLIIKYRPYMSAPALTYKPAVAVFFFTLLIAYVAMTARCWFDRVAHYRAAVAGLWTVILVSVVVRPATLNVMLQHVGLAGYGDPLDQLLGLVR